MYFVFLVIAAVSRSSLINARPAVPSVFSESISDSWISSNTPLILSRDEHNGEQNLRTMSEIVWTCLITVFACSWVSVHPNIPSPHDSDFVVFRRRIRLMFWAIIAPELLMIWAIRQWLQAKNLAKIYEDRGWTKAHGHFLVMGGFMLYQNGVPAQTLSIEKFHKHLEAGSIDFPNTTEEDIVDRSKADLLSRIIVMIQVAWFAVQCIARRVQGLTITELEIVTLAFTTLNGAMYAFWWNKPLDVRRPVRVDFKSESIATSEESPTIPVPEIESKPDPTPETEHRDPTLETKSDPVTVSRYTLIRDEEEWLYMDLLRNSERKRIQSRPDSDPNPLQSRLHDQTSKIASSTRDAIVQPFISIWEYVKKEGLFSALFYAFVTWPIKHVLNGLGDIVESDDSKKVRRGALRVPTFYAPMMVPDAVVWVRAGAAVLGVVFGSIHMAAWSGTFATYGEQTAWRVATLIVTILPTVILVANILTFLLIRAESDFWSDGCFEGSIFYIEYLVGAGGILVYVPSRFTLFIIAFVCLGSIPPDGFQRVDWMSFIPHISA